MEGASVRVVWRKNLAGVEGTLWILHSTQRMRIPYEIELQFCRFFPCTAGKSYHQYLRSNRFLYVTKFNQKRNNVICPKQLCCADQHLRQHTQFPIDRSGIRLNSKLFAQTVVRRAVIMWRELVKRVNPSYIFQEDEDRTRCNRHVWQPSLAQHALDANTWAGGGSLGYFAHASAKFTEARLSHCDIAECANWRFRPPFFFFVHYPLV